mmetsp:Transcript_10169/g.17497  ORF Transcript_10169/g.17497 Transcript_10169/m.17497 type:complete len:642 (+) Transcript_10169:118-2043(+)|eukprot:CAMPEP_0198203720 /NCGR_PEP_ID=MMETSP1445-20131203/7050_1 /TAXON_ID=36898 /ORGANISM="Pyramimonas sp., Strain CCMP2087" /LENGTH=641 /DNA_ID=CAMNT_0043875233 /DNA_START=96 /DNA_END=2021 /DNA_ORIENTATION=-
MVHFYLCTLAMVLAIVPASCVPIRLLEPASSLNARSHFSDDKAALKNSKTYTNGQAMSVYADRSGKKSTEFRVQPRHTEEWRDGELVWGRFNDTYLLNGWGQLEIHTNPLEDDVLTMRAAGYFEGFVTGERIEQHAHNIGVQGFNLSKDVVNFIDTNRRWQKTMFALSEETNQGSADQVYWHHANLLNEQLEGLHEGYKMRRHVSNLAVTESALSLVDLLHLNLGADMEDILPAIVDQTNAEHGKHGSETASKRSVNGVDQEAAGEHESDFESSPVYNQGRCSALVKLLPDNSDVYIGQTTWTRLEFLLRIYKLYDFPLSLTGNKTRGEKVPAARSAFSSFPGQLFSGDDFYLLSSGLQVQETTIGNDNEFLNTEFVTPMSLMEWQRNVLANRLAAKGSSWCPIYEKYNSGTYNNQNMVFDFNAFEPGKPLRDGTFSICEQVPGYVRSTDLSQKLQNDRYFASYNTPLDEVIRAESGIDEMYKRFGDFFTYDRTARALIFARDQSTVRDMRSMEALMRYCDWENDPLSSVEETCKHINMTDCAPLRSAENCIATRGDLMPPEGKYPMSTFGYRNHVAIDAKIASWSAFDPFTLPSRAVSGPNNEGNMPTFSWSTSSFRDKAKHVGHADTFDFPWVDFKWQE